jgi:hypothetical protein
LNFSSLSSFEDKTLFCCYGSGVFDQHGACELCGIFGTDQTHDTYHFLCDFIDEMVNTFPAFGGEAIKDRAAQADH